MGSFIGGLLGGGVSVIQFYKSDVKRYGVELLKWFISDCLGHVAVIPFMLSLSSWRETWSRVRKHPAKGFLAFGCLAVIAVLEMALTALPENNTFFSVPETIPYISHIFSFPCVLLCGQCIGSIGFTAATLFLAISGVCGIVFVTDKGSIDVLLFRFQLFIIVVMISSLSLMVIDKARQEALADALKANNQKSAFMAFLCHELRNPLHAILNINVFLKETPLSPDQRQLLQAMSIASTYMSQIINDVLDTSKFEAGNVTFAREPVDVGGIFRQVALQTREDLRTRHVTFGMHTGTIPRCEGMLFHTDEMRFKQLLNNLLAHAIKVTPPGGRIDCGLWYENIRTVTTLLGRQGTTCTICLEVTDSGPGIPPDVAAIIFKPFQMSGLETSQEYSGTGLGLAICKQIVESMGGTIAVMPRRGGGDGSRFVVKIPLLMCGDVEGSGETTVVHEEEGVEMEVVSEQAKKPHTGRIGASPGFTPETPWLTAAVNREPVLPSPKGSPPRSPSSTSMNVHFSPPPHPDHVVVSMDEDITELVDASNTPENPPHLEREVVVIPPPGNIRFSPDVSPWEPTPQNPSTYTNRRVKSPSTKSSSPPRLTPPHPSPSHPPSPSDNRAILIVDDSSINRKILVRLLRRAGVTRLIDECVNGLEAVKKVRDQPGCYIGIFMDLQMPVMDGTEATKLIREIERGRVEVGMPIVAVTASCVEEEMLKMEFGFTALAPKPFLKADAERILREFEMG
ncbi:hypothetical protein BC829DRAFT_422717 [Chytridium lagenaria]|nr:hypothetical protein BC829DRAFT_422717 [Chytridium lagenaria]